MYRLQGDHGSFVPLFLDVSTVTLSTIVSLICLNNPEFKVIGITVFFAAMVCNATAATQFKPLFQMRFIFLLGALFSGLLLVSASSSSAKSKLDLPIVLLAITEQGLAIVILACFPKYRFIAWRMIYVVGIPILSLYYIVYQR